MTRVREATDALVEAVEESEGYIRFQKAKKEMLKYPLLKAKVDEFRKRNYELQSTRVDIFEESEKLQQEYSDMLKIPVVREFLSAENGFCRIIQQINWQLIEALDFESELEAGRRGA